MLALATALVAALTATMLRPSTSEAASTPPPPPAQAAALANDVTWTPGDEVSWEYLPDEDRCITTQSATVTASTPEQATQLVEALQSEGPKTDFPPETGVLDVHANVAGTANGPDTQSKTVNMVIHSYVTKEQCEAAVTPDADATLTGLAPADTSQPMGGEFQAAATWYKGALAGLYASVIYIGFYIAAAGTILFLAEAAGAMVSTVLVGAAAGCIGGAAAGALTTMLFSDTLDGQKNLRNAVGGCVLGALTAAYPLQGVAERIAETLESAFGVGEAALFGRAGVGAATSASVEMTGPSAVISTTTSALRAAS